MKIYLGVLVSFLVTAVCVAQENIGDFNSLVAGSQNKNFVIPSTHRFQRIIEEGDPLTEGGTLPGNIRS